MTIRNPRTARHVLRKYSRQRPHHRAIAVFDCDGTLIKGDIGEAMLYFQLEHYLFRTSPGAVWPDHPDRRELDELHDSLVHRPRKSLKRNRRFSRFADMVLSWYFDQLAQGKTEKACVDIVRLFAGFTDDEVRQIAEATVKDEMHSGFTTRRIGHHTLQKGVRFVGESLALLKSLQVIGCDIWVISGSNRWSVEAVLRRVHFPPDHVIGIDLVETNNTLSSIVKRPVPVWDGKVKALQQFFRTRPQFVVSDSTYDLPLFNYSSGMKILVHTEKGSYDRFFASGGIRRDDSWLVIDKPTLLPGSPPDG